MTKILDQLPILEKQTFPKFDDKHIKVRRDQILVWVSIHLAGVLQPEKNIPKIPALLDTGFNFDFSIQDRHLREWAGINPALLPLLGDIEINDQTVNRHEAAVWLHPNVPGKREVAIEQPPYLLEMKKGIAVYPPDAVSPGPRLPLLGLAALLNNDLDFWLDPELRHVSVQTRTWRRRLMRLLCRV
jgi:hypothetical protein